MKGAKTGVITDFEGKFTLSVTDNSILIISYLGYVTQNVSVKGQTHFKITLKEDTQSLDEVVVVGYGVQKKRDLTGAISSVKMSDTPIGTFSTTAHALAGKAAGLQVTQSSAQVGGGAKFRIRGETSINAGNDPCSSLTVFRFLPLQHSTRRRIFIKQVQLTTYYRLSTPMT